MRLRLYLFEKGLTVKDLANLTLYSRCHISNVLSGLVPMTDRFAKDVMAACEGQVAKNEIVEVSPRTIRLKNAKKNPK